MPLLRLIAEGVGPFERLDIDLSDGKGNPHLGPHIFAGVNGSGKSTILSTLAWVMDPGESGFRYDDWSHLTAGHSHSRAVAVLHPPGSVPYARACTDGTDNADQADLATWARSVLKGAFDRHLLANFEADRPELFDWTAPIVRPLGILGRRGSVGGTLWSAGGLEATLQREGGAVRIVFRDKSGADPAGAMLNVAAYSPSRALRHITAVDLTKRLSSPDENSLAFESTVQNEFIQSWLLGLYSKRAIARDRHQSGDEYARSLERLRTPCGSSTTRASPLMLSLSRASSLA